jgi:hypothetical protein
MRLKFVFILILSTSLLACLHKKKTTGASSVQSDRKINLDFYPFWGGSASCELERKSGTDKLVYTYHLVKSGVDTTYASFVTITHEQADSVFLQAEKIDWQNLLVYGTAEDKNGLRVNVSLKKGPAKKYIECQRLKNTAELPPAIYQLAEMLNKMAPEEMKLY